MALSVECSDNVQAAQPPLCGRTNFRRPHMQQLDGPFLLPPGEASTRVKQIAKLIMAPNSGADPGQYDVETAKDSCARNVHTGAYISATGRERTPACTVPVSYSQALTHGFPYATDICDPHRDAGAVGRAALPDMTEGRAVQLVPRARIPHATAAPTAKATRTHADDASATAAVHALDSSELHGGSHPASAREDTTVAGLSAVHSSSTLVADPTTTCIGSVSKQASSTQVQADSPATLHAERRHDGQPAVHLRPPPPAVAASATRSARPGSWDWCAARRACTGTFTMQHGGAFRHDRARADVTVGELDKYQARSRTASPVHIGVPAGRTAVACANIGVTCSTRQAGSLADLAGASAAAKVQHAAVESMSARPQSSPGAADDDAVQQCQPALVTGAATAPGAATVEETAARAANKQRAPGRRREVNAAGMDPALFKLDPCAQDRHRAAKKAAAACRRVQRRQQRWRLESELLPMLKRDAALGRMSPEQSLANLSQG